MILTQQTPITDASEELGLSKRTVNACLRAGMTTLGDILSKSDDQLCDIKGCGTKSNIELVNLKEKCRNIAVNLFSNTLVEHLKADAAEIIGSLAISEDDKLLLADEMDFLINEDSPATVEQFINSTGTFWHRRAAERPERGRRHELLSAFFALWTQRTADSETSAFLAENLRIIEDMISDYYYDDRYYALSPLARQIVETRYAPMFASLSVRARNIFGRLDNFEAVMPYAFMHLRLDHNEFRKCGKATEEEVNAFVMRVADMFESFLAEIDAKGADSVVADLTRQKTASDFPFLDADTCLTVADATLQGETPVFWICYKYIQALTDKSGAIYRRYYGIAPGEPSDSLDDIAADLSISRERVRQISCLPIDYIASVAAITADVVPHGSLLLADDNPFWDTLPALDKQLSIRQIMGIICSFDSDFTIVSLPGSARQYLVKKEIITNIKLARTFRKLQARMSVNKTEGTDIIIDDYLFEEGETYHPQASLLRRIFSDYYADAPDITVTEDGQLFQCANKTDIIKSIESILETNAAPMSFEELMTVFNSKHPDSQIDSRSSFRSYIQRSSLILPLGRKGVYILKSWTDYFTGPIIDFIEQMLDNADTPLPIDTIVAKVEANYGTTTTKSILSLISLNPDRFEFFADNVFGISGRDYSGDDLQRRRRVSRSPFDVRFAELEHFVAVNGHFPIGSNADEETLRRWVENVEKGRIDMTAAQKERYAAFSTAHINLPRNTRQYDYRCQCRRLMLWICRTGKMPTMKTNHKLCEWYNRIRSNNRPHGDVRDTYRRNLLDFIDSFGL